MFVYFGYIFGKVYTYIHTYIYIYYTYTYIRFKSAMNRLPPEFEDRISRSRSQKENKGWLDMRCSTLEDYYPRRRTLGLFSIFLRSASLILFCTLVAAPSRYLCCKLPHTSCMLKLDFSGHWNRSSECKIERIRNYMYALIHTRHTNT